MDFAERAAHELVTQVADIFYVLRVEPDFAFEYVSPSVARLVGYSPEDHYADPNLGMKLIDPRDIPVLMETFSAEVDTDFSFSVRWISKDGRTIWTEHSCRKTRRPDETTAVYGVVRDVSRQHEVEDELRRADHQSRMILDNILEVLLEYDAEGFLMWASPSLEKVFGWRPEDVVGTHFSLAGSEDRERIGGLVASALRDGLAEVTYRFAARLADGTRVWAESRAHAVWDGDSNPTILESVRDVTAEVEAEENFRAVAEHAADVVLQIDGTGRILWCSPTIRATLGWEPMDVIGRNIAELISVEDLHRVIVASIQSEAGHAVAYEARFRRKPAGNLWLSMIVRPVLGPDGRVVGRVVSGRDISAERATRDRLRSVAATVSEAVLRAAPESVCGFPVAVRYQSAARDALVGGDLYEIIETEWGARILIADVMGKGLAAVHLAADVAGVFRESGDRDEDLLVVAGRLDRMVSRSARGGTFVTALVLQISRDPISALAMSMGHPDPWRIRGGAVSELELPRTRPLGLGPQPRVMVLPVREGDVLFCHTDGLSESRNSAREFFDVKSALTELAPWEDLGSGLDALLRRLEKHSRNGLDDDVAMLCLGLR